MDVNLPPPSEFGPVPTTPAMFAPAASTPAASAPAASASTASAPATSSPTTPVPSTSQDGTLSSVLPHTPPTDVGSLLAKRSLTLGAGPRRPRGGVRRGTAAARVRRGQALPRYVPRPSDAALGALRGLWTEYAARALEVPGARRGEAAARLDLHGAEVEVVRARHPGWVGLRATLVAESARMLWLAPEPSEGWRSLKLLPKDAVVLKVRAGNRWLVYNMGALMMRSSERSAKKFKKKNIRTF